MVPFSGFSMPVQYNSLSGSESHHFTRNNCSIFDVSHMVQHRFSGPGATAFLEKITPAGLTDLKVHTAGLSTLLLPLTGGIVDDTLITRLGPQLFYVVTNAGCREKDFKYLKEQLASFEGEKVDWEVLNGWGLVAIQGPKSEDVLSSILVTPETEKLREMFFGQSKFIKVRLPDGKTSSPLLVSRGGYTGEDGFEISIPESETVAVTQALLDGGKDKIALAGLGARDSLRLEAGMCLYGHDLDETITPVEASLSWIIPASRRSAGGFHGDKVILSQLTPKSQGGVGVERRRIGIVVDGAPAREGAEIVSVSDGQSIGKVTSGCPSPSLKKNIAIGYVKDGFHKSGTEVDLVVRGKKRRGVITKMPFVPTKYWKGMAPA